MTAYYLFLEKKRSNFKWLAFVFVLFAVATVNLRFNAHFNELAWIDERNYPGGPLAFLLEQQALAINIAGNIVSILSALMASSTGEALSLPPPLALD